MSRDRVITERLILRRLRERDLDDYYHRIYADPEVMKTLPGGRPLPRDVFETRARENFIAHWDTHAFGPWIVERRSDARLLGHAGLRYWPGSEDVEVFYAVESPAWGQGFAFEAARASVTYGFEQLGLGCIIAGVLPDNAASVRILEKIGMEFWERRRIADLEVAMYRVLQRGP